MKKTTSVLSIILALLMAFSVVSSAADALTLTSAAAGSVDLLAAENPEIAASDSIILTFSNNVTDESVLANNIGKINVKDSEGNKISTVSVTAGGDKTQLSVSLGDIAKGSYTLTAAKGIKAKNESELADKVEIKFTVAKGSGSGSGDGSGGGNNPLSFVSAKVDDKALAGAELEGKETIVIEFDRGMKTNEADNAKLIGVYKADGSKADCTVLPVDDSKDETKRLVKVQLNELEGGEYTLKIGKDVKANNGNTLGEDKTVSFTVKAQEEEPAEKTFIEKIVDFFNMIIGYVREALNKVLGLVGVTL